MPNEDDTGARFALVIPALPASVRAARRVPARVREELRITVHVVDDGHVDRSKKSRGRARHPPLPSARGWAPVVVVPTENHVDLVEVDVGA